MQVTAMAVGMLQENCYLVHEEKQRQALIIDPGDDSEVILQELQKLHLTARGILLTHAHVDHIRGIPEIVRSLSIPVYCQPDDRALYFSPANALPPWIPAARDLPEPGPVKSDISGLSFTVLPTPGHTQGGVCYYFPSAATVFAGDTLFQGSIGRTDLPGGNLETLLHSIREKLMTLPPETIVYPGHGEPTTIGDETASNRYLTRFKA